MVDATVATSQSVLVHEEQRLKILRSFRLGDRTFKAITMAAAVAVLVLLAGVMLALLHGSLPALREFGLTFLTSTSWNLPLCRSLWQRAQAFWRTGWTNRVNCPVRWTAMIGGRSKITGWTEKPSALLARVTNHGSSSSGR